MSGLKLVELEVKNFATYREQMWDFTRAASPVFVSGETGSGKTTFFIDALTSALYGRAYGEMKPGSVREVISSGASQAMVRLVFEVGGERYILVRVFYRKGVSKAQLRKMPDGKEAVVASSVTEVDLKVLEIVGMDYRAFLNTVVIRQGEVASIISKSLDPAERRQIFLHAFNIEFQRHQELAKVARQSRENQIAALDGQIEQLEGQVKVKLEIEEVKRSLQVRVETLSKEIAGEEGRLKAVLKRVKHLEAESVRLNKEVVQKKSKVEELGSRLEDMGRTEAEASDLQMRVVGVDESELGRSVVLMSRMAKLAEQEERLKDLKTELMEAERTGEERKSLEAKVKALAQIPVELKDCEKRFGETQETVNRKRIFLNKKTVLLSRLGSEEDLLQSSGEECPVCHSRITQGRKEEIRRHLEEESERLEDLCKGERSALSELEKEASNLDKKIQILREESAELSKMEGQLKGLKTHPAKVKNLQDRIAALQDDFDASRGEIESFTHLPFRESEAYLQRLGEESKSYFKAKERLELLKELTAKMKRETDLLRSEVGDVEQSVKDLERVEAERREFEVEEEALRRRIDDAKQEHNDTRGALRTHIQRLEELGKMEILLAEKKVEREEGEIDRQAYEVLETKIFHDRGVPSILLKDYIDRLELHARRYLSRFMPDKDIRIEVTEKHLAIKILDGGVERELETYSGGESVITGFAIRLATGRTLAEALTQERPRFLIIDEGFGPLDENLRVSVVEALHSLQSEYEQIYVISHMTDIKNYPLFQTLVEVEKSEDGSVLKTARGLVYQAL